MIIFTNKVTSKERKSKLDSDLVTFSVIIVKTACILMFSLLGSADHVS